MKLCILGGGLTGLSLAKSLVKKGLSIDIFLNKKKSDFNRSRTIGISNYNLNYFYLKFCKLIQKLMCHQI